MPFKVTFLKWKNPLSKEISDSGTKNFPNAKNLTSESKLISDINGLYKEIKSHAKKGHCLLKGPIQDEIKNESRAGKVITTTPTNWLVIDIDKLEMPCQTKNLDQSYMESLAEDIMKYLPTVLQNCTYIVQASSSLGFKDKTVSLHLFFVLDRAIAPSTLKQWLTNVNLRSDYFRNKLEITKNGWGLKYTVDRCVADNTRIIYIAPPVIKKPVVNPFNKDEDRIVLVKKDAQTVSSALLHEEANESLQTVENNTIKQLRKAAGFDVRSKAKYAEVTIEGNKTNILLNPATGTLIPSYTSRGFCYYNIGTGDSNAYYHPIGKPDYIFNFKDEPIFRWKDVDPVGFENYVQTHGDEIRTANPIRTFAVISKQDDLVYKITHDADTDIIDARPSDLTKVAHFYRENGQFMPDTIHEWDIVFDPKSLIKIDYDDKMINTYEASDYLRRATEPNKECTYENLQKLCPSTFKLLRHVFGNGEYELRHWINWIAFIVQEKRKSNTCWFLWGVQGTGKGVLFNHILKPMFGKQNVGFHLNTALEDTFDAWRVDKQLVVIDEFELPHGKKGDRVMERIKNWTAEGDNPIRDMRKIAANIEGIEAYMFFSNRYDMIKVEDHDRRFNIAPRQEMPLKAMTWWNGAETIKEIDDELQLFTNFVTHYQYDEVQAREALINEAKIQAANATKTAAENFCTAIKNNDLEHFLDVLYIDAKDVALNLHSDEHIVLQAAKAEVKRWVHEHTNSTPIMATPHQMATVYQALSSQQLSAPAVSKMMARHGITSSPSSYNGKKGRYFKLTFNPPAIKEAELKILMQDGVASVTNITKGKTA